MENFKSISLLSKIRFSWILSNEYYLFHHLAFCGQLKPKFIIEQSYSSDEYITKHHKEAHYRWTNFAKSGGVLNIDHKFI